MLNVSKTINAKNKSILIIGDSHIPYEHCDYLDFCYAVSKKYKCKLHFHIGDEVDYHAISFHDSISELPSAGNELQLSIERLSYWYKKFPKLMLLSSNHGSLVTRRLKHHGIPVAHLKPLNELYETEKWQWHDDILIKTKLGSIYLCHGKSGTYNKLSREIGCSAVQGHFHGKQEITWANSVAFERFNMFVGCGINIKSMAFAYGKNNIPQPLLGCGVIDENGIPIIVKMVLDGHGRWNRKL